jgi:hypothetical protein
MVAQKRYTPEELAEIFHIESLGVQKYLMDHGICFFKDKDRFESSEWDLKEWSRKREKTRIVRKRNEGKEIMM